MNLSRYIPLVLLGLCACSDANESALRRREGVREVTKVDSSGELDDLFEKGVFPKLEQLSQEFSKKAEADNQQSAAKKLVDELGSFKRRNEQWKSFVSQRRSGDALYRVRGQDPARGEFVYFVLFRGESELTRFP